MFCYKGGQSTEKVQVILHIKEYQSIYGFQNYIKIKD